MLMELIGTMMSIVGNEIAIRMGRRRDLYGHDCFYDVRSLTASCRLGGSGVAAMFIDLQHNYADLSSLTAGTVGNEETGCRGATLAVHAMFVYGGGFADRCSRCHLDILGGETVINFNAFLSHYC